MHGRKITWSILAVLSVSGRGSRMIYKYLNYNICLKAVVGFAGCFRGSGPRGW